MRRRWNWLLCFAFVLGSSWVTPRSAWGQDAAELQQARDKFQNALALQTGGDWAGALALLKEVAAVRSTPQVRFNIALCEENLGQLVAAVGDYELAAADARETDEREVIEQAQRRLDQLRGRIPKVVVERGNNADTATITLDGVTLGDQVIGKAMNVDPGPHVVTARATGYNSFRTTVRVAEAETKSVAVSLTPEAAPAQPRPPAPKGPRQVEQSNTTAYVVGGIGLASLAGAGVMFGLRQRAVNELNRKCTSDGSCPPNFEDTANRGKLYTLLGNIGLGVGALGVGLGAIFLLSSDGDSETGFTPGAPESVAGLSYVGKF